ncbi:lipid II flippase MurJ [Chitinimonas taiwanensis]|uniref:Putative peptidoglycan lipid II flippase n=1 Tax=Chitinimonas taiwanensis DSM 18899 TaxID=1121279 RepID=A0A1K2HQC2_9NEIS|nr:lipid II flippase MurJ [Chitinimonas taiwanensis]SFZ78893.1 putative peptidoglycan lipid II flippase [Chitinimonas taiwanensis DSM 18899]
MSTDGNFRFGPWVIGASALLGLGVLAGRLSGLVREVELASSFGVSARADVAVLLLTLPDLLVNLLLSGGLTAALVPRLKSLQESEAQLLIRQTLLLVLLLFGLFAIFFSALPNVFFSLLAPGILPESLPSSMAIIATALAIPLTAASGVTTAALSAQHRFLIAGLGTLVFNVSVIAALMISTDVDQSLSVLGLGIAVGAGVRFFSQLACLHRGWFFGEVRGRLLDLSFVRGFLLTALSASLMLLVPVIVRALASNVSDGAISAFNYATKLVELPMGVLITSIATVALARLSHYNAHQNVLEARTALHDGVRRSTLNGLGAGLLVAFFAEAIVALVFGGGAMSSESVERVTRLTRILMVGLPFLALTSMAMAALNSQEKHAAVLKATIGCLLLLPVFALPGLWMSSEGLLACAVVLFQTTHALALARLSGLIKSFRFTWWDTKMTVGVGIVVAVSAAAMALDFFLRHFTQGNSLASMLTLIIAMGVIVIFSQRST